MPTDSIAVYYDKQFCDKSSNNFVKLSGLYVSPWTDESKFRFTCVWLFLKPCRELISSVSLYGLICIQTLAVKVSEMVLKLPVSFERSAFF